MAKFQIGTGIDKYITRLENLEFSAGDAIGQAIYVGADIVADEIKNNIRGLPTSACSALEKRDLIDGFGIAKSQNDNGYINVKTGFDGYDSIKTKKYPKGRPISMLARSIESGTSFRTAVPFVNRAIRSSKDRAEKAMAEAIEKTISKTMG